MKKLNVILLLALFTFISCGKNEVVNSSMLESMAQANPINKQMAENLKEYRAFIVRDGFVRASISYEFELFHMENDVKVSECFFDLLDCTENVSNKESQGKEVRSEKRTSEVVSHRFGTSRTAVRRKMTQIIDQAVGGYNFGYGRFVIALKNGETHYFDLNLPLSANPTSEFNYSNNKGVSLKSGGGWYTVE